MRIPSALCLFFVAAACGGDDRTSSGGDIGVAFRILRGDAPVPCAEVPGIDRVEVRLLTSTGNSAGGGYPKDADCQAGAYSGPAPAGSWTVEVAARGLVGGTPDSVLFSERAMVQVPSSEAGSLAFDLRPDVAMLEIGWSFGASALEPCGGEVAGINLLVSQEGSQSPAFQGTLACAETPKGLDAFFSPGSYVVRLEAVTSEGAVLYSHQARRALQRGENPYTALLAPRGGQLRLDWDFAVGADHNRTCSAPTIAVDNVAITVSSPDGDPPVSDVVACTEPRPHLFRMARFSTGRRLMLTLEAEGRARFLARHDFVMPDGDYEPPVLSLEAVSSVQASLSVATATCAAETGTTFQVSVRTDDRAAALIGEASLNRPGDIARFDEVPYGSYLVSVEQRRASTLVCARRSVRSVDGRTVAWALTL